MHEYDMVLEMRYGRGRALREAAERARLAKSCPRQSHPWLRRLAWAGGLLIALGGELQRPARRAGLLPEARAGA